MRKIKIKYCKKHGNTEYVEEGKRNYYRCKRCRIEHVTERRKKVKRILVEENGGECIVCGYNKSIGALYFHHKNPDIKEFGIASKGATKAIDILRKEAKKCVLICSNCHAEIHEGLISIKDLA